MMFIKNIMRTQLIVKIIFLLIILSGAKMSNESSIQILVFTKTTQYYHKATPNAIKALYEIGHEQGWRMTFTEDATFFTDNILKKFRVIIFLQTGGDLFNNEQRDAFKKFIHLGNGFVGIHSATVTENSWPWFKELVGAYFIGHPPVQEGKLIIENKQHPATKHFKNDTIVWTDEWYSFDRNPRAYVDVLISLDETSYNIEDNPWFKDQTLKMGDHPIVWCHEFENGRSIQTALGHISESYSDKFLRLHIIGAIKWAAKLE